MLNQLLNPILVKDFFLFFFARGEGDFCPLKAGTTRVVEYEQNISGGKTQSQSV